MDTLPTCLRAKQQCNSRLDHHTLRAMLTPVLTALQVRTCKLGRAMCSPRCPGSRAAFSSATSKWTLPMVSAQPCSPLIVQSNSMKFHPVVFSRANSIMQGPVCQVLASRNVERSCSHAGDFYQCRSRRSLLPQRAAQTLSCYDCKTSALQDLCSRAGLNVSSALRAVGKKLQLLLLPFLGLYDYVRSTESVRPAC